MAPRKSRWQNSILTIDKAFWANVDKAGEGDCWNWTGQRNTDGRGRLHLALAAHRISFELHKGPIPDDKVVLHACDNPLCVNPAHLSVGTQKENLTDAAAKGRMGPKRRKLSQLDVDTIRQRYLSGDPSPRIAGDYNINPSHVTRLVRGDRWNRGYAPPKDFDRMALSRQPHFGEENPRHRFSDEQIRRMRGRYWAGNASLALIAREFNTDATNVRRRIVRGVAWSHLE